MVTMLLGSESNHFRQRIWKTFQTKNQTIFPNQTIIQHQHMHPQLMVKEILRRIRMCQTLNLQYQQVIHHQTHLQWMITGIIQALVSEMTSTAAINAPIPNTSSIDYHTNTNDGNYDTNFFMSFIFNTNKSHTNTHHKLSNHFSLTMQKKCC